MTELLATAETALKSLRQKGAEKCQIAVTRSEAQEFEVQGKDVNLLRSTFDQGLSLKVIHDQRQAVQSNNQFEPENIHAMATAALKQAQVSAPDAAYDIAPAQGQQRFNSGLMERNDDWAYEKMQEALDEINTKFPNIVLKSANLKYVQTRHLNLNTHGNQLESHQGCYEMHFFFTGKDGKKTSSFNYTHANIGLEKARLMSFGGVEELMRQSVEQVETRRIPEKFDGELIITPHSIDGFVGDALSYLRTGSLLTGQSIYKDKLNQKIAADHFTLRSRPLDTRFIRKSFWTSDGFLTQNQNIIENGILKNFLLDQYGATKLKAQRSVSEGSHLVIDPGTRSLQEMIRSVKKGILLCRFSGGNPSENGDFSGVAKNSYYIQDGEIQFPVGETMVSGNLGQLLLNISDISKETINFGNNELPWVKTSGFTVS